MLVVQKKTIWFAVVAYLLTSVTLCFNASSEELMASVRKMAVPIDDHPGYVTAVLKLLRSNDKRPNNNQPMADAQLLNLKIEDDLATAVMKGTFLKPRKSQEPITFRRMGLAWKIDQLGSFGTTLKPIDRPDEKGFSQLHRARGIEAAQTLIDQGADVNVRQRTLSRWLPPKSVGSLLFARVFCSVILAASQSRTEFAARSGDVHVTTYFFSR